MVHLGLKINSFKEADGRLRITVDQIDYINGLEEVSMPDSDFRVTDPLPKGLQGEYRRVVGELLWCSGQTRVDVAFDVATAASFGKGANFEQLRKLNKIVKCMKRTKVILKYDYINSDKVMVLGYCDAAWANMPSGKTGGGYLVGLTSESSDSKAFVPVSWRCRSLKRVIKSTLAGDTLALTDLADELFVLGTVMSVLMNRAVDCLARTDCRSLWDHLHFDKQVSEKRLLVEMAVIREMIEEKRMRVERVETAYQLADCLTKHMSAHMLLKVFDTGPLPV